MVGGVAGDLISRLTGVGDYTLSTNSIVQGNAIPTFYNSGDGMEICHREFLRDVTGTTDFSLSSLPINPGMSDTFPWLSQVASNFEEYEMKGLVFEYRPSSGSVATTSAALGVVIYATNYDVLDPLFTTKQQMDSYEYSSSTVPFDKMLHAVECDNKRNVLTRMYVRDAPPPIGADLRFYDLGNFQYATKGMQSSYVVGELWVTYHVRLSKPRIWATSPVPPPPPVPAPVPDLYHNRYASSPSLTATNGAWGGTDGFIGNADMTGAVQPFMGPLLEAAGDKTFQFIDPTVYMGSLTTRPVFRLSVWGSQSGFGNPFVSFVSKDADVVPLSYMNANSDSALTIATPGSFYYEVWLAINRGATYPLQFRIQSTDVAAANICLDLSWVTCIA